MELLEPDFYANGLHGPLDISGNVRQWVPDWLVDPNNIIFPGKNPNIIYLTCFYGLSPFNHRCLRHLRDFIRAT
jgi:hypothetical protein